MSHDKSWKPIYFEVKGHRSRSRVTKTLPARIFALLWVLASSSTNCTDCPVHWLYQFSTILQNGGLIFHGIPWETHVKFSMETPCDSMLNNPWNFHATRGKTYENSMESPRKISHVYFPMEFHEIKPGPPGSPNFLLPDKWWWWWWWRRRWRCCYAAGGNINEPWLRRSTARRLRQHVRTQQLQTRTTWTQARSSRSRFFIIFSNPGTAMMLC